MEEQSIQYPAQEQHLPLKKKKVCSSMYSVHISMTKYVLVCTEYIHHMNASSNLGVEGMKLHQHVAHDRAEQRQLTATSAPSMLRESK